MAAFTLHDQIERRRFLPLPFPDTARGRPRRTGIEIEFAGLTESDAAACVQSLWGGRIVPAGPHRFTVEATRFGDVIVELDSALKAAPGWAVVIETLGDLVPVEIVTAPLAPTELPAVDDLVVALRHAGARGTRDGAAFGFGLHLNPEVVAPTAAAILPTVRAFGLLEDWLRASDPIDPARRLLPFVRRWPRALVDRLAIYGANWGLDDLADAYLDLTPTRNRALDLMPLIEHLFPGRIAATLPGTLNTSGRPTWHYRLPEARVDEPSWTIAYEWNRWRLVEAVAADEALLRRLADTWQAHRAALTSLRGDWALQVEAQLGDAFAQAGP